MMWKRMTMVAAGLASVAAFTGCLPQPVGHPFGVTRGTVVCDGGSATATVEPGVTTAVKPATFTLRAPSTTSRCVDGTGSGIESAQIVALSLTFPALSCSGGSGSTPVATGTATIRWSDGTTSDAAATATLGGVLSGTLHLAVTSGHIAGSSGSADFLVTPAGGDCSNGITAEDITLNQITLAA